MKLWRNKMDIWNDIFSIIISNGVFAILFVLLFCYQLKDSQKRENKYVLLSKKCS